MVRSEFLFKFIYIIDKQKINSNPVPIKIRVEVWKQKSAVI